MEITDLNLPEDVIKSLSELTDTLLKNNIPYFVFLPIPSNPILAQYFDENDPALSNLHDSIHQHMMEHQYACIARMIIEKEQVIHLKRLKGFDVNFQANALKYLTKYGLQSVSAKKLILNASAQSTVDYTLIDRIQERK